jgi:hypothetical protein
MPGKTVSSLTVAVLTLILFSTFCSCFAGGGALKAGPVKTKAITTNDSKAMIFFIIFSFFGCKNENLSTADAAHSAGYPSRGLNILQITIQK